MSCVVEQGDIVSRDILHCSLMLGEWMLIVLTTKIITKVRHGN
jgi:hypothetical protein